MAAFCIGGVCIPYSIIFPLLALTLQYLAYPLVRWGILPHSFAKRLGINVASSSSHKKVEDYYGMNNNMPLTKSNANGVINSTNGGKVISLQSMDEYRVFLKSNAIVIVKFTANWCKPCKAIHPFFESLAFRHTNVGFSTVDVDELDEASTECGVVVMPTFVAFRNGEMTQDRVTGKSERKLETWVRALLT